MNKSKVAIFTNKIMALILNIIGWVFGALFLLATLISLFDDKKDEAGIIIACLVIVAICVLVIVKANKINRRIKRFKTYVGLISMENMTSIENIASSTSQSIDFVKMDIQKMIDKKYFTDAYLDKKGNELVINKANRHTSQQYQEVQQTGNANPNINVEMQTVTCGGCGAMNSKQVGVANSCEFCGSPL